MPQLTYRLTSPNTYRVSVDGVEIGSISLHTRRPSSDPDVLALENGYYAAHEPRPSGDIEPPAGFEDALKALKEAFTQWRVGIPDDLWHENLEHKRDGAERWK